MPELGPSFTFRLDCISGQAVLGLWACGPCSCVHRAQCPPWHGRLAPVGEGAVGWLRSMSDSNSDSSDNLWERSEFLEHCTTMHAPKGKAKSAQVHLLPRSWSRKIYFHVCPFVVLLSSSKWGTFFLVSWNDSQVSGERRWNLLPFQDLYLKVLWNQQSHTRKPCLFFRFEKNLEGEKEIRRNHQSEEIGIYLSQKHTCPHCPPTHIQRKQNYYASTRKLKSRKN